MAHNRFALTDNNQHPKESVLAEVACFMYAVAKNMFLTSYFFFLSLCSSVRTPPPLIQLVNINGRWQLGSARLSNPTVQKVLHTVV